MSVIYIFIGKNVHAFKSPIGIKTTSSILETKLKRKPDPHRVCNLIVFYATIDLDFHPARN